MMLRAGVVVGRDTIAASTRLKYHVDAKEEVAKLRGSARQ